LEEVSGSFKGVGFGRFFGEILGFLGEKGFGFLKRGCWIGGLLGVLGVLIVEF